MKQLTLPFVLNEKMLLTNFMCVKNGQVVDFLNKLFEQKTATIVYICGSQSSGKTHLLQGCAFAAFARKKSFAYIDFKQSTPDKIISNIEFTDWLCLDNIDYLDNEQQQELFNLYNRMHTTSLKLIISAKVLSYELGFFKDLQTRLSLATVFYLQVLNDSNKKVIIKNKIKTRNLCIEEKIWDYLFRYYSRDLAVLLKTIDKLDEASLQQKHNITIPFIKQTLNI